MRIAWFRDTATDAADPLDGTVALIAELRHSHHIDVVVEANAHDFVWQQLRCPWDLCVFELDNTHAHQFVWGYLAHYSGVVMLHTINVANLRVAMLASRAVVVCDGGLAELLQDRFPDANVRYAPACSGPERSAPHRVESGADLPGPLPGRVRFAVFDERGRRVVDRAFDRARNAGAVFEVLDSATPTAALGQSDVVIAPGWPPFQTRPAALAAMAAGKAVVTTETEATAAWPALDPQTWRPRGLAINEPPIAVTVDPRDEEHSLMLAVRRLSSDSALRAQLGRAARAWWETHATPARAATAWAAILQEATTLYSPPLPTDWPKQFLADGTALAGEILREFGLIHRDSHR